MNRSTLISSLLVSCLGLSQTSSAGEYPSPLMVNPGELVFSQSFDNDNSESLKEMSFRKEAHHEINTGTLKVIPPVVAYADTDTETKWSSSNMARAGFDNVPLELIAQLRWKYLEPEDEKDFLKGRVYLDLGHRCIRLTITPEGSALLLENHLVGKESESTSIVLQEDDTLKLEPDHWYETTIEVKGEEVVIQLDGKTVQGKHALISKERYPTLNLDVGGVGYLIDEVVVHEAGDYTSSWQSD